MSYTPNNHYVIFPTRTRTKLHMEETTTTITTTTAAETEVETVATMVAPTTVVVLPTVIPTSWLSLLVKNHFVSISNHQQDLT